MRSITDRGSDHPPHRTRPGHVLAPVGFGADAAQRGAAVTLLDDDNEPRRQVGALPFRLGRDGKPKILLVTSRESRRWVIPKGWPMKGRKPFQAAAREAYEEAGLRGE